MELAKGAAIFWIGLVLGSSLLLGTEYRSQTNKGFFEGSLRYVVSRYSPRSGKAIEREQVDIVATAKRLSIPSLDMADVFANNAPPGVSSALFRHDSDDFIIYGNDADAYQFKGYDRILLGVAFRALALSGAPVDLDKPVVDGPFALRNFRAMRSRYRGKEGMRFDMYFSQDYRVNWGVLGESWLFGSGGLRVPELDSVLQRGEVPIRVEVYKDESKLLSVNLMAAEEYRVAESLVALPAQKILRSSTTLLKQLAAEAMGFE